MGWGGWKLGRDDCKPILQMRKGKPREGQELARPQSPDTVASGLQPGAPAAFPLLGPQAGREIRGHCVPGRSERLAPGDAPGSR